MNPDAHETPAPENIKGGDSDFKPEFYLQFYAKLVHGICYVKHFEIQSLPIGLRELVGSLPNPEGWRLRIFELLGDSTFKSLKPSILKDPAYCYGMGFLGGVVINCLVYFTWAKPDAEDEKIIEVMATPLMRSIPEIPEKEAEKAFDRFWNGLQKQFFNTPYKTVDNLAEIFCGLHDGILAIPVRGEHVLFDSVSTRVYAILLVHEDKIEAMNSVAEMYEFVAEVIRPGIKNLDPDTFKKICQRIGLQGRAYKSMDTPNDPVP